MTDKYQDIIQQLNKQIEVSQGDLLADENLKQIRNMIYMKFHLLLDFTKYIASTEIAYKYEVFILRNWIHFCYKNERVFVVSWTDRLSKENRFDLVERLKNNNATELDFKLYLQVWGMNDRFKKLATTVGLKIIDDYKIECIETYEIERIMTLYIKLQIS